MNDPNDAFIGYDHGNGDSAQVGISFGAPKSLSNYIGNVGDGKSWKEQLTAKAKTFAVPVVIQDGSTFSLGGGEPISSMDIKHVEMKGGSVPSQSCVDMDLVAAGVSNVMQVVALTPPGPLGDLSLNAYVPKQNTVLLHFCNVSTRASNIPAGDYSFFAVR